MRVPEAAVPPFHVMDLLATVEMLGSLDEPVKRLVVASPADPTGTMLSSAELAGLGTVAAFSPESYADADGASTSTPTCPSRPTTRGVVALGRELVLHGFCQG